jgi:DNA-binding NarL/FixJ family response regulator
MVAVLLVMGDTPGGLVLRRRMDATDDVFVVGQADDAPGLVRGLRTSSPDVAVVDCAMASLDGVAATRRVLAVRPQAAVIALASPWNVDSAMRAMTVGAHAYLPSASSPEEVLAAVRSAAEDHRDALAPPRGRSHGRAGVALTGRQREVLELVAAGCSNQQISTRLDIDVSTVEAHVRHVVDRLKVRDRADAVHWLTNAAGDRWRRRGAGAWEALHQPSPAPEG